MINYLFKAHFCLQSARTLKCRVRDGELLVRGAQVSKQCTGQCFELSNGSSGSFHSHVLECKLPQGCKSTVLILIDGKCCLISAQTHKLLQAGCWEVRQGMAAISPSVGGEPVAQVPVCVWSRQSSVTLVVCNFVVCNYPLKYL